MASSVREKMIQVEKDRKIAQRAEENSSVEMEQRVEKVRELIKAARQEPIPAAPVKEKPVKKAKTAKTAKTSKTAKKV